MRYRGNYSALQLRHWPQSREETDRFDVYLHVYLHVYLRGDVDCGRAYFDDRHLHASDRYPGVPFALGCVPAYFQLDYSLHFVPD